MLLTLTGSLITDYIVYAIVLIIGGYWFALYEKSRKAKKEKLNDLLEIERNVSTFKNHLLGCSYDFALKTIGVFYYNIQELKNPDGDRIIIADNYDEYGHHNQLEWLFQKGYKRKEVCASHFITMPSGRVGTVLNNKISGVEYILHPAKDGETTVQLFTAR